MGIRKRRILLVYGDLREGGRAMKINFKNTTLGTKVAMLLEMICGILLIALGIVAKEPLAVLSGMLVWIFVIDMITIEGQRQFISMLDLLCDVQQEILAEKFGCTRTEIDIMCTEKLKDRNEKSI